MINRKLAEKKGLSQEVQEKIIELHQLRNDIELLMDRESPYSPLQKTFFRWWTQINFELQGLWGFFKDESMHKGYLLSKCSCPIMDNEDMGSHYYFNASCIYHGEGGE